MRKIIFQTPVNQLKKYFNIKISEQKNNVVVVMLCFLNDISYKKKKFVWSF